MATRRTLQLSPSEDAIAGSRLESEMPASGGSAGLPRNTNRKVKVLYIAGYGRSGTTILDHVLAEIPGITTTGELRYAWDRGLKGNWFCACGQRFRDCEFWRDVFDCAFGGMDKIDPAPILRYRDLWTRIPYRALSTIHRIRSHGTSERSYLDSLETLYLAVQEVSGCRILVDSSKWPDYCAALRRIPSIDLYSIHMIRDPRAVAGSWMNSKKFEPDNSSRIYTPKHSPLRTSIEWILWNTAITAQCAKDAGSDARRAAHSCANGSHDHHVVQRPDAIHVSPCQF